MLKIKNSEIKEVVRNVFLVVFDRQYDLAMTFCPFQEYYESPKFRNKYFTWHEFMRWYSLTYGNNAFSYPKDYNGFNIPSEVLFKALNALYFSNYSRTRDDEYMKIMVDICRTIDDIRSEDGDLSPFYLIGVHKEKGKESYKDLVTHEISHGLYYTNENYKRDMNSLIRNLEFPEYDHMIWALRDAGYGANFHDEFQAYMSTGLRKNMSKDILNKYRPAFKKVLKKYLEKIDVCEILK